MQHLRHPSRRRVGLAAVACGIGLGAVLYWQLRPRTPDDALNALVASFHGSREICGYLHPGELKALGLSETEACNLVDDLALPLKDLKFERTGPLHQDGSVLHQKLVVRNQAGRSQELAIEVYQTPEGPRVMLGLVAVIGFRVMQQLEGPSNPNWKQDFLKHSAKLRKGRLTGFWSAGSNQIEEWPTAL